MKVYCKDCKHFYCFDSDSMNMRCKKAIEVFEDIYSYPIRRKQSPEEMNYNNQCKVYEKGKYYET